MEMEPERSTSISWNASSFKVFGFRVSGFESRGSGFGFGVWGLGSAVWGLEFGFRGLGVRVFGFRVQGLRRVRQSERLVSV